ncbi:MAG: hypothetical protein IJT68_08565 [Lentisphaeria bacterium]|nr:hypothetical protein [Lentisphaeria bacterium]
MDIISSGIVAVSSGVTSTGLYVIQDGILQILSKGQARQTSIGEGGKVVVSSGGILYVCTVSSGGTATVLNRGFAQDATVENGGLCLVSSGGTAFKSLLRSGGVMTVYAETTVAQTTILDGGMMNLSSGAYARNTVVSQGGVLHAWKGALADVPQIAGTIELNSNAAAYSATVLDSGRLAVLPGGYASDTRISSGGSLDAASKGIVNRTLVCQGGSATLSGGASSYSMELHGGEATLAGGAFAQNTDINSGGTLRIASGATATGIRENGGYVQVADGADAAFVSNTISGLLLSNASATVHSGTILNSATLDSGGKLEVFHGGKMTGELSFEEGAIVSAFNGAVLDFDISELTPEAGARVNDLAVIQGAPVYTLTVSAEQTKGVYTLAEGAAEFNGTITVQNTSGEPLGTLAAGETLSVGDDDFTLNLNGASLTVTIQMSQHLDNLVGTKDFVSWDPNGSTAYLVEYSTDDFAHGLRAKTSKSAVDMLDMPAGTYQWRVKPSDGDQWTDGNGIESDNTPGPAKVLQSDADGNGDLFFASPNGTWDDGTFALHMGSVNDWTGTRELVSADGKRRIRNLFFGSDDANILCLTDDENGDAIFVDDVYTELPEGVGENLSRLYKIREIRAGAGDDIVDMTSQRFEYTGDGLTIRGGDGDDVIWANKGGNRLFGDAGNDRVVGASGNDVIAGGIGNDRMHGGGGDDTFVFCENWGADTVEQRADGKVTLWFASGGIENWDAGSLTYTDGENSVRVSGVAAENVLLRFGDDGSAVFEELVSAGAFLGFSSEKIFEESGKGILASL